MKDKSVILLSGGLDSTLAFLLAREETDPVLAITFDYGQNSAAREIQTAKILAKKWGLKHQILTLDFLKNATHPLTGNSGDLPQLSLNTLDDPTLTRASAHAVWVANRNGTFINIAASLAEQHLARFIYVGFNREEAATFPDNSKAYVDAINVALTYSTLHNVSIKAPTINMDKTQIVAQLVKFDFDFSLLWSCYREAEQMCGTCESCLRLKRALLANNVNLNSLFQK